MSRIDSTTIFNYIAPLRLCSQKWVVWPYPFSKIRLGPMYGRTTSLKVRADIYVEQMYEEKREMAVSGTFTFVALDEHKNPIPINKN